MTRIRPGVPYSLGATWDGADENFAIFSKHATKVELCLFNSPNDGSESSRVVLPEQTDMMWHGYLTWILPGQIYGYRIHGPYEPLAGQRFYANKIVLDPYAKAIARTVKWASEMYGYRQGGESADLTMDRRNNAAFAPLEAVVDSAFTWGESTQRCRRFCSVAPNSRWRRYTSYAF